MSKLLKKASLHKQVFSVDSIELKFGNRTTQFELAR